LLSDYTAANDTMINEQRNGRYMEGSVHGQYIAIYCTEKTMKDLIQDSYFLNLDLDA
jgi:hypothetical protein